MRTDCFAFKGYNKCSALTVEKCLGDACKFYKSIEKLRAEVAADGVKKAKQEGKTT